MFRGNCCHSSRPLVAYSRLTEEDPELIWKEKLRNLRIPEKPCRAWPGRGALCITLGCCPLVGSILCLLLLSSILRPEFTLHALQQQCAEEARFSHAEGSTERSMVHFTDFATLLLRAWFSSRPSSPLPESKLNDVQRALATGRIDPRWGNEALKRRIRSVAIVGGGPSGLLAAKYLQDAGLTATVFEASHKVGGLSSSHQFSRDGAIHELGMRYVPIHPPPLQQTILEELEEEAPLQREFTPTDFDVNVGRPLEKSPFLGTCSRLKIASDLMVAVNIFEQLAGCPGVHGAVECEIAEISEDLEAWLNRNNLECFGSLLAIFADSLFIGPALKQHAGYALKSSSYFVLQLIFQELSKLEVSKLPAQLLPPRGLWLRRFLERESAKESFEPLAQSFVHGYDHFWQTFVRKYNLDVRLAEKVVSLSPDADSKSVTLETSGSTYKFDHSIVATSPSEARDFLPPWLSFWWDSVEASSVDVFAWPLARSVGYLSSSNATDATLYPATCEAAFASGEAPIQRENARRLGSTTSLASPATPAPAAEAPEALPPAPAPAWGSLSAHSDPHLATIISVHQARSPSSSSSSSSSASSASLGTRSDDNKNDNDKDSENQREDQKGDSPSSIGSSSSSSTSFFFESTLLSWSHRRARQFVALANATTSWSAPSTVQDSAKSVAEQLTLQGFHLRSGSEFTAHKEFTWPLYIKGENYSYHFQATKTRQGVDGLSFIGGTVAGLTVPAIFDFLADFFISGEWLR